MLVPTSFLRFPIISLLNVVLIFVVKFMALLQLQSTTRPVLFFSKQILIWIVFWFLYYLLIHLQYKTMHSNNGQPVFIRQNSGLNFKTFKWDLGSERPIPENIKTIPLKYYSVELKMIAQKKQKNWKKMRAIGEIPQMVIFSTNGWVFKSGLGRVFQ